jgi:uncharacterized protein YnzC (UPF0291/DUF896 family)
MWATRPHLANIFEKLLDQKTFICLRLIGCNHCKNNLLRKCGLLVHTSPAFLKNCWIKKLLFACGLLLTVHLSANKPKQEEFLMTPEKIARINELAKKQKAGTLTDAEKEEQAALRLEYRQSVVGNLRQQLNNVEFVEPDGKKTRPCHNKKKK